MKPLTGRCSTDEREALAECMNRFFTKKPLLQSTPPKQDKDKPRVVKPASEIQEAWKRILEVRREYQADDRKPISDPGLLATMWNNWQREWMDQELTETQQQKKHCRKTSIFHAWVFAHMGGKNFVMAIWQTGMTWAPSPDLLNSDFNGALEHVATHFARWTRRLARAVYRHKEDKATVEARVRSGNTYGTHGLTAEEEQNRRERYQARRNYRLTQELERRLEASKGKGQGKGQGKTKRGASEHTPEPKSWEDMSAFERWWLAELWNGNLWHAMKSAEEKCYKVSAPYFRMNDDD